MAPPPQKLAPKASSPTENRNLARALRYLRLIERRNPLMFRRTVKLLRAGARLAALAVLMCAAGGPRPARTICSRVGGWVACWQVGPDRCRPDHPTYQRDVATGACPP